MSDAGRMTAAAIGTLLLLFVVGFGWARWALGDLPGAMATAAAFGVATLTISSLLVERAGFGSLGVGPAGAAAALAGGGGYLLLAVRRLREGTDRRRLVVER